MVSGQRLARHTKEAPPVMILPHAAAANGHALRRGLLPNLANTAKHTVESKLGICEIGVRDPSHEIIDMNYRCAVRLLPGNHPHIRAFDSLIFST